MRRVCISIVTIAAATGLLAGCQNAVAGALPQPLFVSAEVSAPQPSTPMPEGQASPSIPVAFAGFCQRNKDQCSPAASAPGTIMLSEQTWRTIVRVNTSVNRAIWPMEDQDHYKRGDHWTIPTDGYGDCEDYALTKRAQLIAAGFSRRALRIALVTTWRGTKHAVLTVATDKGDYVLDNLNDAVKPWGDAGYTWLKRQDSGGAWGWVALNSRKQDPLDIVVAAMRGAI